MNTILARGRLVVLTSVIELTDMFRGKRRVLLVEHDDGEWGYYTDTRSMSCFKTWKDAMDHYSYMHAKFEE